MKEQIKLLVEYQELDKEIKKIDDGILKSEEAVKYYQAGKFLSSVTDSLNDIDKKAQNLVNRYNAVIEEIKNLSVIASEHLIALDECKDENELSYISKKYKERMNEVSAKENELNAVIKEMEAVNKEFSKLGADRRKMKEQFDVYKPKFEELKNSKKGERDQIKLKQAKIENSISPEIMAKYSAKRKDKKFPIVFGVALDKKGAYCPACGSSLSVVTINTLDEGKLCECDTCRAIIYGLTK